MDSFIILILDITGNIFVYGPLALLVVVILALIVLRVINRTDWVSWDRVNLLFDWAPGWLPASVAIGGGFRAASNSMQGETPSVWLNVIAAGVMIWLARRNFLKIANRITQEERSKQAHISYADDDEHWNPNGVEKKSL